MKGLLLTLAILAISFSAVAQGTVNFNNKVGTLINAKVLYINGPLPGTGVGAGFTAELVLVAPGGSLTPLTPTTTFKTATAGQRFFVNGITLTIPGTVANQQVTLRMRAWETAAGSYDLAQSGHVFASGGSNDILVTLGGPINGAPDALPGNLDGLQSFTVSTAIPEPATYTLLGFGGIVLAMCRRKRAPSND